MQLLEIGELFKELENVLYPKDLDIHALAEPMPFRLDTPPTALIYVTEKVGRENMELDLSSLSPDSGVAVVVSRTTKVNSSPIPIIRVDNVRVALSYALSRIWGIDYDQMKFIGITGTNGKTTTATLIYKILKGCGYKVGFIGTGKIISDENVLTDTNYSMTTPDPTVLYPSLATMSKDGCRYVVMEVSSHSIALGKTAPIKFEYAIFTNLDNDHLDFHKSKEDYFLTKLKLFSRSKKGLFNMDDEYGKRAYQMAECEKSSFGIINPADAYATNIELKSLNESSFFYREPQLIFKAVTKLGGAFNVYNTLASLKCVIDLGIKPCIAKEMLSKIDGVDGRMEIIDGVVKGVIDYAHTPMAFYSCLKTLKNRINMRQSLIVVFGCGGERDKGKRSVFGEYAEIFADKIIITEDNSRSESFDAIANDISKGIKNKAFEIVKDREKAIKHAFKNAKKGDVVAVIGKGHERYKIVGGEYLPFDERKIIHDAIEDYGGSYESRA